MDGIYEFGFNKKGLQVGLPPVAREEVCNEQARLFSHRAFATADNRNRGTA